MVLSSQYGGRLQSKWLHYKKKNTFGNERYARKRIYHRCEGQIEKILPLGSQSDITWQASWCQTVTLGRLFLSNPHIHDRILYYHIPMYMGSRNTCVFLSAVKSIPSDERCFIRDSSHATLLYTRQLTRDVHVMTFKIVIGWRLVALGCETSIQIFKPFNFFISEQKHQVWLSVVFVEIKGTFW